MTSASLRVLAIAATILGGLVAGINLDRVAVQMPAWRRLGLEAWARYSRKADLGNGLVVYPAVAIIGALLTVALAVAFLAKGSTPTPARVPVALAALSVMLGLLATARAAPIMLSLRRIGDDPIALRRAFTAFDRWTVIRAVAQIGAFTANLWALVALLG